MLAHAVLAAADRFIAIPTQLERHGCTGLQPARLGTPHGSAGSATLTPPGPSEGLRVEDPRNLRRKLEGALASQRAQDAFVAGLAEVVADEGTLRRALLPMVVTSQASTWPGCWAAAVGEVLRVLRHASGRTTRWYSNNMSLAPSGGPCSCHHATSLRPLATDQLRQWRQPAADDA
jgi:hypothetical protein